MKYHLYWERNYKKTRKSCAQGRHRDKTIEFGDSSPQSWIVEYVWKVKGNGDDNVRMGKCARLSEGGSWTSLAYSLPRSKSVHGKSKQTSEGNTDDWNWRAEASITNEHRLGAYNYGKLG